MRLRELLAILGMLAFLPCLATNSADAIEEPVILGESIGPEIDAREREDYHLFPNVKGFESARLIELGSGKYRIEYTYRDASGTRTRSRRISAEALEQTRLHITLSQAYREARAAVLPESLREAEFMRILALRFANEVRYDVATALVDDLRTDFPTSDQGRWAADIAPRVEALAKRHRALIWPGALVDQRGRTNLLVFTGYYGLWLGVAVPIALDAQDAQAYAGGLLVAPPLSILIASAATKDANISEGQATIISLGGHLGTWQGIGWSALGNADGNTAVGAGVLAGLGGIAAAIPIGNAVGFSEGHAGITSSAMYWGGWFGAVFGVLANHDETEENGVLRDMLISSDVLVLAAGIAARKARLSAGRMRLINLAGVLGTTFGLGIDLLVEVDSEEAAFAIAGAGSVAGLALGTSLTREYDRGKDLARGPSLGFPQLSLTRGGGRSGQLVPTIGMRIAF